jgi:hypothetical protein
MEVGLQRHHFRAGSAGCELHEAFYYVTPPEKDWDAKQLPNDTSSGAVDPLKVIKASGPHRGNVPTTR